MFIKHKNVAVGYKGISVTTNGQESADCLVGPCGATMRENDILNIVVWIRATMIVSVMTNNVALNGN